MFVYLAISGAVVLLAALLVRLWWDLVEVYIVRNAMDGELQVRHALLPAFRLLVRHFFRAAGCFFGWCRGRERICLLPLSLETPPRTSGLDRLFAGQLGLFLLLSSRFWQRGIEAALVMSADPPMLAAEEIAAIIEEDEPTPAEIDVLAGMPNPHCATWC